MDSSLPLKAMGALLLLLGLACAFVAPLEIHTFYAFSDGGRLHFEGFGVGSLVFALIAVQAVAYYVVAAIGIALGYGHLTLRRWARALMVPLLWLWLLVGLPLTLAAIVLIADSKQMSPTAFLLVVVPLAILAYPVVPALLLIYYNRPGVTAAFGRRELEATNLETIPLTVRVLCLLLCLYVLALHFALLLRGVFPFFGVLLTDWSGMVAVDVLILVVIGLIWGLARLRRWAWWGTVATFGLVTLSTLVTLPLYTLGGILAVMAIPDAEMALFGNAPLLDLRMTIPAAIPLIGTLGVILATRRHFQAARDAA